MQFFYSLLKEQTMNQRKSLLIDLGSGGGGTPGRWGNPVRWGYQKSWGRIGVTSNSHHIRTITIKSDNS